MKKYVTANLEERVSSENVKDILYEIVELTHTEGRPGILFNNISKEIGYSESSIGFIYKGRISTVPKRVCDYLLRLKKRLNENKLEVTLDRNDQKLVIHFWDFEKAYNNILGTYKIGDCKLNYILEKKFKTNAHEIEKYLNSKEIKGKKMKDLIDFLKAFGNTEKMSYSPSKVYHQGDYFHSPALGLGEVVEVNGENMKVNFGNYVRELKCRFVQDNDVMASNFTMPMHESYVG